MATLELAHAEKGCFGGCRPCPFSPSCPKGPFEKAHPLFSVRVLATQISNACHVDLYDLTFPTVLLASCCDEWFMRKFALNLSHRYQTHITWNNLTFPIMLPVSWCKEQLVQKIALNLYGLQLTLIWLWIHRSYDLFTQMWHTTYQRS